MIAANELRIGNWLSINLDKEEHISYIPALVIEIGANECRVITLGNTIVVNNHNLKPIPLTEEILLKCGAKIGKVEVVIKSLCMEKSRVCNGYYYTGGEGVQLSEPIHYIHQLQNLFFALTNQELEVKL